MRKIYITVAIFFVSSVLLFISSFVYLDKSKHQTYYYVINKDDKDAGFAKIDKYVTEEALIYKSLSSVPFYPKLTDSTIRLDLARNRTLDSYYKESSGSGAQETLSVKNAGGMMTCVSTFRSEFVYMDGIPLGKDSFIFEIDSLVTYLPIIENYNFKKGRSQGANAIVVFAKDLPPMKRFVTLTSIADEYVKVDSREIKTEHLLLKIRNHPHGGIWVSKSDRSIIKVDIPKLRLKITRTFLPRSFEPSEYSIEPREYISRETEFRNKNIRFAGTITIPRSGSAPFPGLVLIGGDGPQDRNNEGLFSFIADYLSARGWCVLRFDKRGMGMSSGDYNTTTDEDAIEDAKAAIESLIAQKEVDPQRVAVVGHGRGAFYALAVSEADKRVRSMVLMAPDICVGNEFQNIYPAALKNMASISMWPEDYVKLANKAMLESRAKARESRNNRESILRAKCFLKKMRDDADIDILSIVRQTPVPALIAQGNEDESVFMESAARLDKILSETESKTHKLIYFSYLGHLFGKPISDGVHRIYYETDSSVLETIGNWLDTNTVAAAEAAAVSEETGI